MIGDELVVLAIDGRGAPLSGDARVTAQVGSAAPVGLALHGSSFRGSLARGDRPLPLRISIELAGARYVAYDTLDKRRAP